MTIEAVSPQVLIARAAAAMDTLALLPGQIVDAKVVGPAPGGLTQIAIGKQTLTVSITPAPEAGTTLQLQVASTGRNAQLLLLSQTPPPRPAQPLPLPIPATTTSLVATMPADPLPVAQNQPQGQPAPQPQQAAPQPPPTSLPQQPAPVAAQSGQPASPAPAPQSSPQAASPTAQPTSTSAASGAAQVVTTSQPGTTPVPAGQPAPQASNPQPSAVVGNPAPPPAAGTASTQIAPQPATGQPSPTPTPGAAQPAAQPAAAQLTASGATTATSQPQSTGQMPTAPASSQAPAQAPSPAVATAPGSEAAAKSPAPPIPPAQTQAQRLAPAYPPPQPATPSPATAPSSPAQVAMAQVTHTAATRQNSIAPLLAGLAGLGPKLAQLPPDIARPAAQLLAAMIKLDRPNLDGETIRQAISRSGVFLESKLLTDPASAARGDIKASLLQLRSALSGWLGADAAAVPPALRRPPPVRGGEPRSERIILPQAPDPGAARDLAKPMLDQADAALHRMRLMQMASLPDDTRPGAQSAAKWDVELPFLLGNELSIARFQVNRDGRNETEAAERGWQMRFSINFAAIGEVGAHVALRGKRTSVMLWADSEETAEALEVMLPDLAPALQARGLEPGSLRVRRGVPEEAPAGTGSFVDSTT